MILIAILAVMFAAERMRERRAAYLRSLATHFRWANRPFVGHAHQMGKLRILGDRSCFFTSL